MVESKVDRGIPRDSSAPITDKAKVKVVLRDAGEKTVPASGSSVNPFVNNNMEGSRQKLTFEEQVIYKRPTKVYMITLLILALTTIAVLVPLVVVVLERNKLAKDVEEMKSSQNSRLCTSEQCVKSAGIYLDNMNQRADPCDNFFEYACGGWVKKKVIPEDRSSFSAFTDLREEVAVKCKGVEPIKLRITKVEKQLHPIKELFERDGKPGEAKSITSVRNFYKSCLDLDKINEKNSQPLMDLLQALGGWPVLGNTQGGNWNRSSFQFESFWAFLSGKYGADLIVSSWVGVDDKNSSSHILKLDQPSLGLGSRDYYRDAEFEEERAAYLQYMVDVIVELGGDEATARPEMANVLEFETTIANMSTPKAERRDNEALYNIYTLEELTTVYPQINWTLYYDLVMPEKVKPILPSERIVNRAPAYMENLTDWLEAQDNRVIANYMVWRLVDIMVPDLGQTFIDIYQRYLNVLRGTSTTSARWKRCVNEGNIVSEFAIGRMYVEENFPAVAKEKTVEMIGNLKTAFKAMLETNDWLQEADKKVAAEKADKMRIDVGYPDWIMDDVKLDEKYQGLDFLADTYFENSLLFRQWSRTDSLSLLRDIVDRTAWTSGPAVVNAYFSSSKNRILFPAGILQPPFYHQDLPWYSNYGGIGVVIGHEITHGFDDRGRQYDKDGNLVDWWSADSVVKFKERAQCIVDQYGDFVMPETGETLNGVQTQGENIADNGGLKESYKAYKDNVANEPALPGLNFTADQMFFLTFGQIWCSAFRPEGVTSQILSGVHSPGRYRVIGPMQNNEAFAKAFSCPPTSYMNPADKCNVW